MLEFPSQGRGSKGSGLDQVEKEGMVWSWCRAVALGGRKGQAGGGVWH